jgi:hypothetical protein
MSARRRRVAMLVVAAAVVGVACWSLGDRASIALAARATTPSHSVVVATAHVPAAGRPQQAPSDPATDAVADTVVGTAQAYCMDDRRRQLQQRRAQLGVPGSPDTVVEDAVLTWQASPGMPAQQEAARALIAGSRRWPTNIELAWFSALGCVTDADCKDAWRHLASLEPDNAAVWMMAMATARRTHDAPAYEQALRRAGAARVYQPHHGLVFLHARAALAGLAVPDRCRTPEQLAAMRRDLGRTPTAADWADLEAGALEAAMGGPGYSELKACRASAHPAGSDRQDCIALLSLIATGNTLVDQKLALHMLLELAPESPEGDRDLRERYRQLAWLIEQTRIPRQMPAGYPAQLWMQGEVATLQARAIAEGRWPPPADWLPADAESCALIRGVH